MYFNYYRIETIKCKRSPQLWVPLQGPIKRNLFPFNLKEYCLIWNAQFQKKSNSKIWHAYHKNCFFYECAKLNNFTFKEGIWIEQPKWQTMEFHKEFASNSSTTDFIMFLMVK